METKLKAYIGYVVPVLTYTSQVWYPSKTDKKSIEKIQHKAMKWICSGNDEYHQRLETLKKQKAPTLHVHGNARCPLSPLIPRRQLLRPLTQTAKAKRKRNKTKTGI